MSQAPLPHWPALHESLEHRHTGSSPTLRNLLLPNTLPLFTSFSRFVFTVWRATRLYFPKVLRNDILIVFLHRPCCMLYRCNTLYQRPETRAMYQIISTWSPSMLYALNVLRLWLWIHIVIVTLLSFLFNNIKWLCNPSYCYRENIPYGHHTFVIFIYDRIFDWMTRFR